MVRARRFSKTLPWVAVLMESAYNEFLTRRTLAPKTNEASPEYSSSAKNT